jgi:glucose-specific phosphotransferase system IIA component
MTTLRLLSPLTGVVRPVSAVPDPVFAEGMVGPGLALEPQHVQHQTVLAPADGTIGALHPHAFALEVGEGRTILVHLGIDTVGLAGRGFELHVDGGQSVRAGDRLVTWSPVDVSAAGLATICPVVALQADPDLLTLLVADGDTVEAGQPLLDWA